MASLAEISAELADLGERMNAVPIDVRVTTDSDADLFVVGNSQHEGRELGLGFRWKREDGFEALGRRMNALVWSIRRTVVGLQDGDPEVHSAAFGEPA